MKLRGLYAFALRADSRASLDDVAEATTILDELSQAMLRIYGPSHPTTKSIQEDFENARSQLDSFGVPARAFAMFVAVYILYAFASWVL